MNKHKIILILILAVLLMGAMSMNATLKVIYLPIVIGGNMRQTPTLAPTACYGCMSTGTVYQPTRLTKSVYQDHVIEYVTGELADFIEH